MKKVFPQGNDLKDIIERHQWTLYDATRPEGVVYTWEELDKMAPATAFAVGHNYLFVPIPKKGETLRQAYTPTKGLGPSLTIENPDEDRWLSLYVQRKANGNVALFSRLFMEREFVVASSPRTIYLLDPDVVIMKYESLVDTFRKHFRIVSPDEYGVEAPIPMP
ncbi:hypothetical protein HY639_01860 [Candidatus Woesearchaeota archaeon]|nr:hypothetical protein [Candidatus Woesearchaeota archaeon]